MNFNFYLEKLFHSKEFLKFKKQNKDAYLCSAFFSIDKSQNGKDNQQHLDFYVPSIKRIFSFKLNLNPIEVMPVENLDENYVPTALRDNSDFDFEQLEKVVEGKMFDEKINKKIEKILISLQNKDGKNTAVMTIFISGLGLISLVYDLDSKEVLSFEKKSFFDFIKIVKKG